MSTSGGTKKGRPFTGAEPLTHDMKVRVSENTYKRLQEYGDKYGVTVAEVARRAIDAFIKQ